MGLTKNINEKKWEMYHSPLYFFAFPGGKKGKKKKQLNSDLPQIYFIIQQFIWPQSLIAAKEKKKKEKQGRG